MRLTKKEKITKKIKRLAQKIYNEGYFRKNELLIVKKATEKIIKNFEEVSK